MYNFFMILFQDGYFTKVQWLVLNTLGGCEADFNVEMPLLWGAVHAHLVALQHNAWTHKRSQLFGNKIVCDCLHGGCHRHTSWWQRQWVCKHNMGAQQQKDQTATYGQKCLSTLSTRGKTEQNTISGVLPTHSRCNHAMTTKLQLIVIQHRHMRMTNSHCSLKVTMIMFNQQKCSTRHQNVNCYNEGDFDNLLTLVPC